MPTIDGPPVFVLGAGASKHTGAPLLASFLPDARRLHRSGAPLKHRDAFERVFSWCQKMQAAGRYVDNDLDNLENVYSIIELGKQMRLDGYEELATDVNWLLVETLDQQQVRFHQGRRILNDAYSQFVRALLGRGRTVEESALRFATTDATIVSFNYDVMLEHAVGVLGRQVEYHLEPAAAPSGESVAVLKLHGSVNWVACSDPGCRADLQVVKLSEVVLKPPPEDPSPVDVPLRLATDFLPERPCQFCGRCGTLRPQVVPPTWSKAVEGRPVARPWAKAVQAIEEAVRLVVIGYSLPPSDTFFRYLLSLGAARSLDLERVTIVDPDPAVFERYQGLFSPRLASKGRLEYVKERFEEYVQGRMASVWRW